MGILKMLISKSKIKKETAKAYLISISKGPFHEVRMIHGTEKVCKIFNVIEGWVPKKVCEERLNALEIPDSYLQNKEKIYPWKS